MRDSTRYAMQAVVEMGHYSAGTPVTAKRLAAVTGAPRPFLSKIMNMLVRQGCLKSTKGKRGGYTFARPKNEIYIAEIIRAVEGPNALEGGILGFEDDDWLPRKRVYNRWADLRNKYIEFVENTSVSDLSKAVKRSEA